MKLNIKIQDLSRFFWVPFPDSQMLQELDENGEYTEPGEDGGVFADMDWLQTLVETEKDVPPASPDSGDWQKAAEKEGSFHVLSLDRDDIEAAGFDPSSLTDDDLRRMAGKLSDDIVGNQYWISLKTLCEWENIPRKTR